MYSQAWPKHRHFDFRPVLKRSLAYVCAFEEGELVGFAYLAWDGVQHGFLLEPTVVPRLRRQGIGKEVVRKAVEVARRRGLEWVHVDYDPGLEGFYRACGFVPALAGTLDLRPKVKP